ncbi:hypothetical protein N9R79_04595 [Vibrio sp.]|nr:hypothetical protein [Vibrio sp.]
MLPKYHIFRRLTASLPLSLLLSGCNPFHDTSVKNYTLFDESGSQIIFNTSGQYALSYSEQYQLQLWEVDPPKLLYTLGPQDQSSTPIQHLRFSKDSTHIITATNTTFAIWDVTWGQSLGLWSVSDGAIRDVAISNNGRYALLGMSNHKVIFLDVVSGRRLEFLAHNNIIDSVDISPNGRYALSAGHNKSALLWDTKSGQIIHEYIHQYRVSLARLDRSGKHAFTSDIGSNAFIWGLTDGKEISSLSSWSRQQKFTSAKFILDNQYLITGSPSGEAAIWEVKSGEKKKSMLVEEEKDSHPPHAVVYDIALTPDKELVTSSSSGAIQIWKVDIIDDK